MRGLRRPTPVQIAPNENAEEWFSIAIELQMAALAPATETNFQSVEMEREKAISNLIEDKDCNFIEYINKKATYN